MTTAAPEAPAAKPAPAAAAPAADPAKPAAQPAADPAKPAAAAPAAEPSKGTILGGDPAKDGEQSKDGQQQKQEGAPEKYADFKLPEGVEINKDLLSKGSELFKKHNLSQTIAQEFVDLQAQNVKAEIDARLGAFKAQVEDWGKQSREAFGANWQKEHGIASKAVERFGTPGLRQLLNETGIGNHPEFVKLMNKVGQSISEDQPIEGRKAGGEAVPTSKLMYPTMEKKK